MVVNQHTFSRRARPLCQWRVDSPDNAFSRVIVQHPAAAVNL